MIESFKLPNINAETISGSICSFTDEYGGLPLKSCVSQISGYQEGSGTPSPSNVRPLHAFSSASLGKCDNNTASLWTIDYSFNGDVEFNQLLNNKISGIESLNGVTFNFNSNGITKVDVGENRTNVAIVKLGMNTSVNFELNHVYYMGGDLGGMRDYYNYSNNTYIGTYIGHIQGSPNIRKITGDEGASTSAGEIHVGLNVPAGTYYVTSIFIDLTQMFGSTIADYIYNLETQTAGAGVAFFKALYPNDYYPYNAGTKQLVGDTLATFTFGQDIYQGYIDWLKGVVVGTMKVINLGDLSWTKGNTISGHWRFITTSLTDIKLNTSVSDIPNMACEIYESITPVLTWEGSMGITVNDTAAIVFVCDENYSDATSFKTAMNGVMLAYELATPIEIPLGGINLLTQQGVNNIFADCGDTTLEYLKAGR